MIKKPFFGFGKPKLNYTGIEQVEVKEVPSSERAVLFVKAPHTTVNDLAFQVGDEIKTGQNLPLSPFSNTTLTSTVTGTITDISKKTGYLGQTFVSVGIDVSKADQWDDAFQAAIKTPDFEKAGQFLNGLPGISDIDALIHPETPLKTLVINGMDKDLLTTTQQMIVKKQADDLKEGIAYLKKLTGNPKVILVVPPELSAEAAKSGAQVQTVTPSYPNSLPKMIMKNVLKQVVPAGMDCSSLGVCFINAEGVASLKSAFTEGKLPVSKMVTVIGKNETPMVVRVRIGTPVKTVLNALHIPMERGDRLVMGGPMTGKSIYTEEMPVLQDTDAILVQDKSQLALNANDPCVNCGECIRACPVGIPVNMLVRLLENCLYEEAARDYDLLSCVECGLCSYVCEAHIPVFHYIMLGKYELALMAKAEDLNG